MIARLPITIGAMNNLENTLGDLGQHQDAVLGQMKAEEIDIQRAVILWLKKDEDDNNDEDEDESDNEKLQRAMALLLEDGENENENEIGV
jgi:hypothetical protein